MGILLQGLKSETCDLTPAFFLVVSRGQHLWMQKEVRSFRNLKEMTLLISHFDFNKQVPVDFMVSVNSFIHSFISLNSYF